MSRSKMAEEEEWMEVGLDGMEAGLRRVDWRDWECGESISDVILGGVDGVDCTEGGEEGLDRGRDMLEDVEEGSFVDDKEVEDKGRGEQCSMN